MRQERLAADAPVEWHLVIRPDEAARAEIHRSPFPLTRASLPTQSIGSLAVEVDAGLLDTIQQRVVRAGATERAAMLLVERINGPSDIETLEAIYRYGSWLRSVYRYEEERIQYERAIRIIRSEYDKDSLLLVRPYREIGNSFRSQGFESPRGASALNSALELLEERPDTDPVELAEAIIDVADWRTAFGTPGSGHEGYLRAWNLLGSAPDGEDLRRALLRPRRANAVFAMNMSVRGLAQNPNDSNAVDGRVLVEFDVDPYGRPENATVRESDPPGFKDDAAVRAVRQSRFRPRIENGQFVFARRHGYLISFRYIPDDRD